MAAYKGPATFPVTRALRKTVAHPDGLLIEDRRHDEAVAGLRAAFEAAQGALRDRHAQRITSVRNDPDLTQAGKEKKLRGFARELENDLADHLKAISAAESRATMVRARLTAPPADPKGESAYAGTRRALLEDRIVKDFKALGPSQRREALRRGREASRSNGWGRWCANLAC